MVETLRVHGGFTEPQPWESLVRDWHVEGLAVRPGHKMIGHTAFLVTARRMAPGEKPPRKTRRPAPGAYGPDYTGPRPGRRPAASRPDRRRRPRHRRRRMSIEVVDWSPRWAEQFDEVAAVLREALAGIGSARVEHVGSTSVPGLAAKPILDIDVIVDAADVPAAIAALESVGYVHRGDLGVTGREAFHAPDEPRRHVYVCTAGTTNVRNHLAVRDVLRSRDDLRDAYAAVKLALAADPAWTSTPTSPASPRCSSRCSRCRGSSATTSSPPSAGSTTPTPDDAVERNRDQHGGIFTSVPRVSG